MGYRYKGYRAAIFDLDGTLCDTLSDIHASVNLTLRENGFPERKFSHTEMGINHGSRFLIAHALPEGTDDDVVTDVLAKYMKIYALHLCDTTSPYPGVPELLFSLKADGARLAILSNKPDALVKRLAEHCFPGVFDLAIGQGEYPVKPSPEGPLAIAARLGAAPEDILFIGDSDVDMRTAHNAGMRAVGVSWGYRGVGVLKEAGAEAIANKPEDILKIYKTGRQE